MPDTLEKDPSPPSSLSQLSPITIVDGTWLATTKQLNEIIDRLPGGVQRPTADRVIITDATGLMVVSTITKDELLNTAYRKLLSIKEA